MRRTADADPDACAGRTRNRGPDRHASADKHGGADCEICAVRDAYDFADAHDCANPYINTDRHGHVDQHADIDAAESARDRIHAQAKLSGQRSGDRTDTPTGRELQPLRRLVHVRWAQDQRPVDGADGTEAAHRLAGGHLQSRLYPARPISDD